MLFFDKTERKKVTAIHTDGCHLSLSYDIKMLVHLLFFLLIVGPDVLATREVAVGLSCLRC